MDSLESIIKDVFSYYLDDNDCSLDSAVGSVRLTFKKPTSMKINKFSEYSKRIDDWSNKIKDVESTIEQLKIVEDNLAISFEEDRDSLCLYFIRKGSDVYVLDGRNNIVFIKDSIIDELGLPKDIRIVSYNRLVFVFKNIEDYNKYVDIICNFFRKLKINNEPFIKGDDYIEKRASSDESYYVSIFGDEKYNIDVK